MSNTYDIVIVGGGPAGCALALALRRLDPAWRVLVLERGDYRALRVGETLPPQTRALFERLGIWDDFLREEHLPAYGAVSAWGSPVASSQEFIRTVERNGWHLDRNRFDAFLAKIAVQRGAELWENTAPTEIAPGAEGGWTLHLNNHREPICCRLLVDATGRQASVARQLGASLLRFDRLIGSMAVFEAGSLLDRDTLVEAVSSGWWYSALLPGRKIAAAFFTDARLARRLELDRPEAWRALLACAPLTAARLSDLLDRQPIAVKTWPAQSQRLRQSAGPDWLAVGDAAAAFDPLSSQGIFFALRSALVAAYAVRDQLAGGAAAELAARKYDRYHLEQFVGYWEVRRDFYRMEQRWPQHSFWQSRHAALTLEPGEYLEIDRIAGKKSLFFAAAELEYLSAQHPAGATAATWIGLLAKIRPDLPPGQALEGLQTLIVEGHARRRHPQSEPS